MVRFKPDGSQIEQYSSKGGNTWGLQITADNRVMWTQPTSGQLLMQTLLPESTLGRGKIEGGEIVCPFHGSRFNVVTGENTDWVSSIAGMHIPDWSSALLTLGKKPQPLRTFPVSVEGQDVFVEL